MARRSLPRRTFCRRPRNGQPVAFSDFPSPASPEEGSCFRFPLLPFPDPCSPIPDRKWLMILRHSRRSSGTIRSVSLRFPPLPVFRVVTLIRPLGDPSQTVTGTRPTITALKPVRCSFVTTRTTPEGIFSVGEYVLTSAAGSNQSASSCPFFVSVSGVAKT